METSECCGAPIAIEFENDTTNFSDDDYDLKIPVRVCSMCGARIVKTSLNSPKDNVSDAQ